MYKKILGVLLSMTIAFTLFQTASYASANENEITVIYENGLSENDMPVGLIDDIIASNPDASNIIIYDVGVLPFEDGINAKLDSTYLAENNAIEPLAAMEIETFIKRETWLINGNNEFADVFQFSVARGETSILSESRTTTKTTTYTGKIKESGELQRSVTGGYTKSVTTSYSGPTDNSKNNSREFRTKFYQNVLGVQETYDIYFPAMGGAPLTYLRTEVRSGYAYVPTTYANYSVDRYIAPPVK